MSSMKRGQTSIMTIRNVPIAGKTVLLQVDYDIPLTEDGVLVDDRKVRQSIPTILRLLKNHCKVVVIAELDGGASLEPAAARLATLLGRPVRFVSNCVGERARMAVKRAPASSVIVLENLQHHASGHQPAEFAKQLVRASGATMFVQDDCATMTEPSVTSVELPQLLPTIAGLLVEQAFDVDMDGIIRSGAESLLRWYPL